MSPAWLGLLKLVLTLVIGTGMVGLIGYIQGGWTMAMIGGIVGALATLYGIWTVTIRSRRQKL